MENTKCPRITFRLLLKRNSSCAVQLNIADQQHHFHEIPATCPTSGNQANLSWRPAPQILVPPVHLRPLHPSLTHDPSVNISSKGKARGSWMALLSGGCCDCVWRALPPSNVHMWSHLQLPLDPPLADSWWGNKGPWDPSSIASPQFWAEHVRHPIPVNKYIPRPQHTPPPHT